MHRTGAHAVVIGATLAGLLAARALADAYEQVTVLDRDVPADGLRASRRCPRAGTRTRCCRAAGRAWTSRCPASATSCSRPARSAARRWRTS
jgi:glycine/D-amino acid oxidase-like deaminating enzyme